MRAPVLVLAAVLAAALPGSACSSEGAGGLAVEVAGATRTLDRAALAALPTASVDYKDHRYTGVRLRDLLPQIGATAEAPVQASAADGYAQALAPETLAREDALLVWSVDGAPLPDSEGPLRLVVPGSPGLSLKRVVRLAQP